MRIACLHTAQSNVGVFDSALAESGYDGVELCHVVRADLLAAAETAGRLTAEIAGEVERMLGALCDGMTRVALGQASMAGAVKLCRAETGPLSSPGVGLRAAAEAVFAEGPRS